MSSLAARTSAAPAAQAPAASSHDYRPVIHYSPPDGFMNDPNGLIFMDGVYHLYYQYNPQAARPGNVHWGHASSRDLIDWQTHGPAIAPNAQGLAFSGSMVWDKANTSGLFKGQHGGTVAVFTRAGPERQTQELAFAAPGETQLRPYPGNPVLDIGSDAFRDPKVFWHDASGRWVMVVALARQHEIRFYVSPNLRDWTHASTFSRAGVLGVDYECPDLVELPVQGGGSRWVLFVSINPGAPTGGSTVQYFVGQFDGQRFVAEDHATRLMDSGQDFYALQTFANTGAQTIGIAWMNNWLYASDIPAYPARGAMTLARVLSLRQQADHWLIVQRFADLSAWHDEPRVSQSWEHITGTLARFAWPTGKALDLQIQGELKAGSRLIVELSNPQGEHLQAGLDQGLYPGFFVDRSGLQGFDHPFWNHKAIQTVLHEFTTFDCHIVIDQCSIELLGMDGSISMSLLHFFRQAPTTVHVYLDTGEALQCRLQACPVHPSGRAA